MMRINKYCQQFKKGKRKVQGVPQSQAATHPDTRRKRIQTKPNKRKSNKRTKSTKQPVRLALFSPSPQVESPRLESLSLYLLPQVSVWLRLSISFGLLGMTPLYLITKTCLYNFNPFEPHFYTVYRGIHYFSYFCSKHRLWVLVRTASPSTTIYVLSRNMKHIRVFYLKIFSFLVVKFSMYLNRRVS